VVAALKLQNFLDRVRRVSFLKLFISHFLNHFRTSGLPKNDF
jgi:hypothetical protein